MEVGHDEVGLGEVDVHAQRPEKYPGKAADREQAHEAEGIQHRRLEGDGTLIESRRPVEDFDCRRHGHQHGEEREDQRRVIGDAHDEHMVRPDKEAENGNGD